MPSATRRHSLNTGRRWALCGLALLAALVVAGNARAGDIVDASCPCGFHKGHLFIFGGRADFQKVCLFPARGGATRDNAPVNVMDMAAGAHGCASNDLTRYDDPSLAPARPGPAVTYWRLPDGRVMTIYEGGYVCPRCGRPTLRFTRAGNWD
jgi:hypothetical protein